MATGGDDPNIPGPSDADDFELRDPINSDDIRNFDVRWSRPSSPAGTPFGEQEPQPFAPTAAAAAIGPEEIQEMYEANVVFENPSEEALTLGNQFADDEIVLEDGAHTEQDLRKVPLISGPLRGPGGTRVPGAMPDSGMEIIFTNKAKICEAALLKQTFDDHGIFHSAASIKQHYRTPGPPHVIRCVKNFYDHDALVLLRPNGRYAVETRLNSFNGPVVQYLPPHSDADPERNVLANPNIHDREEVRHAVTIRRQRVRAHKADPNLPVWEKDEMWRMQEVWDYVAELSPVTGCAVPTIRPGEKGQAFRERQTKWRKAFKRELRRYEIDGHPGGYKSYGDLLGDYLDRGERQIADYKSFNPKELRIGEYMAYMAYEHQVTEQNTLKMFRSMFFYPTDSPTAPLRFNSNNYKKHYITSEVRVLVRYDLYHKFKQGALRRSDGDLFKYHPATKTLTEYVDAYDNPISRKNQHGHNGYGFVRLSHYADDPYSYQRTGRPSRQRCVAYSDAPMIIACRQANLLQSQRIGDELFPHNALPEFKEPCDVFHICGTPGCGKSTFLRDWLNHNLVPAVKLHRQKCDEKQNRWNQHCNNLHREAGTRYAVAIEQMTINNATREEKLEALGTRNEFIARYVDEKLKGATRPKEEVPPYLRVLIIVPTRAGKADLEDVVASLGLSDSDDKYVKVCTNDSMALNDWGSFGTVFADEVCMAHAAILDIIRNHTGATRIYLLGDKEQVGFINRVPRFPLSFHLHKPYLRELRKIDAPATSKPDTGYRFHHKQFLGMTHRCPTDVPAFFAGWHEGPFFSSPRCKTTKSLYAHFIGEQGADSSLPDRLDGSIQDEIWLTMTQAEKYQQHQRGDDLNEADRRRAENAPRPIPLPGPGAAAFPPEAPPIARPEASGPALPDFLVDVQKAKEDVPREFYRHCFTVHEKQGATYRIVKLIRTNPNPKAAIYRSNQHIMTALSRHTDEFHYFSIVRDELFEAIDKEQPLPKFEVANKFEKEAQRKYRDDWVEAFTQGHLHRNPDFPPGDGIKFEDLREELLRKVRANKPY